MPALEMGMHGPGAAVLAGKRLPLATRAKHIDNRRKNRPRRHRLTPGSGLALILAVPRPCSRWHQRLDLAPQRVRHRPRLDLCHLEPYLRPDPGSPFKKIGRENHANHYLWISSKALLI